MSEDEATRFTNLFEALIVANGRSATKALFIQAVHLLGLEASVYTEASRGEWPAPIFDLIQSAFA